MKDAPPIPGAFVFFLIALALLLVAAWQLIEAIRL
jgi:hypothetical protein